MHIQHEHMKHFCLTPFFPLSLLLYYIKFQNLYPYFSPLIYFIYIIFVKYVKILMLKIWYFQWFEYIFHKIPVSQEICTTENFSSLLIFTSKLFLLLGSVITLLIPPLFYIKNSYILLFFVYFIIFLY